MTSKSNKPQQTLESRPSLLALVLWPVLFISQLLTAALFSWHLLAQFDFAYPWAYHMLAIDQHIEKFGPTNRFRPHFETTTQAQHFDLFAQISVAIQNSGKGFAKITYLTDKNQTYTLLRNAEVVHLQDVANLVDVFYAAGIVALLLLIATMAVAKTKQLQLPTLKAIGLGIVGFILATTIPLFVIGPKQVFYWLHVQIFPPDHKWFFYYQESLMTTLMKAPDLFSFIGAVMASIFLMFWVLEIIGLRFLLKNKSQ